MFCKVRHLMVCLASVLPVVAMDLTQAVVVADSSVTGPERKAVAMLVEEVAKRSHVRWQLASSLPAGDGKVIVVGQRASANRLLPGGLQGGEYAGAEGYELRTVPRGIVVAGNDARGVLFGVGHLLRTLRITRQQVTVPDNLQVRTTPKYKLRGHQLGYRPKTNSYDGWSVPMWDQYIRDLAVFGTNAIELIPPRSDDDDDSPHFPLPPMPMMVEMSRLVNEYGLDCWIWYPAMDKDYSDPKVVEAALQEWGNVFRQLPRVDAVFVPGGDPGHTQPKYLMPLLEKQTAVLRQYHPKATMWVSPQSFTKEWMDEFYTIVKKEPAWLAGVVFGPQTRVGLAELRKNIPAKYPIRLYPDITHSMRSQYAVPDWDAAYALTLEREPINPRPMGQAQIFRAEQPLATPGFLTYSEGCNDDVNKFVWSGLGWNPDAPVLDTLRDYSRYFIGPNLEEGFTQGLLALERNWQGPIASNQGVSTTLAQFRALEAQATPQQKLNWRFQQALYRAYYDADVRSRFLAETQQEEQAMKALRRAPQMGALAAVQAAEQMLQTDPAAREWRARVFELAEALYQSARMQLSVDRYQAIAVGRGANLDLIDRPLNNSPWLRQQLARVRSLPNEPEQRQAIDGILNWTNPGLGGFYDDLGNPSNQPHLVRMASFASDPAHLTWPDAGFAQAPVPMRLSWWTMAETLNDQPLEMLYPGLDPNAQYRLRVVYGGGPMPLRITANGKEIQPFAPKPANYQPLELAIPREATASGELRLSWTKPAGLGGNGRGVQLSEVWLLREPAR